MPTPLQELSALDLAEQRRTHPNVPYLCPTKFRDNTANALTKSIKRWLELNGALVERINVMGRPIDKRQTYQDVLGHSRQIGTLTYIPSSGKKGSADLSANFLSKSGKNISWRIEIKMKDTQSLAQKEYQRIAEQSGAVYSICHNFNEFIEEYNRLKND